MSEFDLLCSKEGSYPVVLNARNELIPIKLVIGWRVCIDYHKLDASIEKVHFLMPFIG